MKKRFRSVPTAIKCDSSDQIRTYQNRRNENKFIETKKYKDGHSVARQYMKWETPEGTVKNYTGAKDAKNGRWYRANQQSRDMMLEDYDEIESAEYVASDFSNEKITFDDSCNFTEDQFKFYYDTFSALGDWLENNPIVDDWYIDIDNSYYYITLVTTGGYVDDCCKYPLTQLPQDVDRASAELIDRANEIILYGEPDIYPEDGEADYEF